jgi:diguanylate cyclase (GGDEF)-like protein
MPMMNSVGFFLLTLFLTLLPTAQAETRSDLPVHEVSQAGSTRIEVGSGMGVLVDPTGSLTLAQIMGNSSDWHSITRKSPNFGFTKDAYWFRFVLRNTDDKPLARLIELPISFLDDVHLYHVVNETLQQSYALGDEQPFAQRAVRHRNFVMPLNLAPGANLIYMRLASTGTIEGPLRIWDPVRFQADSNDENLAQGAVIGALLIMIIYNLFVYLSVRDISYLYYVCFVASYMLFHLTLNGYTFAYLWPEAVRWNSFAIATFVGSSALFTCLFTDSFLKLKGFSLPAFYLLRSIALSSLVLTLLTFVLPYSWTIRAGAVLALPTILAALSLGYWRWWTGGDFARFYCLAWTAVLIGMAVLTTGKFGWIPINIWTENASQIGIVLLVVLLSFTLADSINNDRSLRLNAQSVALQHERNARASQQKLIEVTEQANKELEERVLMRTTELSSAMDQLKEANGRLKIMSATDGLTQISNRIHFETQVATEIRRADREQRPMAIIIFDIDHFKRINDTYGHLGGDDCLRALSKLLKPRINRAGDMFARYGGEEFVIALLSVDLQTSLTLAEEFRIAVENMTVTSGEHVIRFTASFGLVHAIPHAGQGVLDLLAAADEALYQAKAEGRNCIRYRAL